MSFEDNIRKVVPYTPGEQPNREKMIKLNTNENPYPPSSRVEKAWKELDLDKLRLYPDPACKALVEAIAKNYGLKNENVFVGVGSDDVLAMIYLTFFNSKKPIVFPDITYSFYDVWADMFRVPYEVKPLDENFKIQVKDYKGENGGVLFPNPNAPTGVLMPLSEIEEIVKANQDVIVVVDEAYIDFGGESALPLIQKYKNVIVVQTYSKSRSMAGIRVGYAMADEALIKYLNDVKYSFNSYTMNYPTLALASVVMEDEAYFKETTEKIIKTRERTKLVMKELGFTFEDSKSNFLFVTHKSVKAIDIFNALREKDIFVRYFKKPERINNYLRITIGTDEEMDELFEALKEIIQ